MSSAGPVAVAVGAALDAGGAVLADDAAGKEGRCAAQADRCQARTVASTPRTLERWLMADG